ncbi:MAG: glycosyltransferase [Myxococcales bacterium]|nr:glycosyltransferase [Myxococcales bacterium]
MVGFDAARARVSIVVPTLDEASTIETVLRHLEGLVPAADEVLVVDGGSADDTVARARAAGARVIEAPRGRARQLNLAVEHLTGDIVCFLHADTWLPHDAIAVMRATLADEGTALAGFISVMIGEAGTRWGISLHNFIKSYYAPALFKPGLFVRGVRLLFGDQAMFCRTADFRAVGGFDEVAIMEEATLCIKLGARGRVRQLDRIVQSSDRRIARWGTLRATGKHLSIGFLWGLDLVARERFGRSIISDAALYARYGEER